ncbi:S-methyl-5-thioribose-1-phosphate isomerase [Candidatus Bathyarchaeota archaeon]|nr:S-methyl-5-thioribose-1-phosphate isomerase [Candidatus Bathyarchaeota archaeon]
MEEFFNLRTVKWRSGKVLMIDQTRLPGRLRYVKCRTAREVAQAIRRMVVRGAPAIGVAAAMGLALVAYRSKAETKRQILKEMESASKMLGVTRPTAVNLTWALSAIIETARRSGEDPEAVRKAVIEKAVQMAEDDFQANLKIGEYGASLIADGDTVLTHCNAGALATVGYGTALAPIRTSLKQGKSVKVIATETRPRLQGARLTAFELSRDRIPVKVITDGMVGYVMSRGLVQKVIVGADRIVRDGVFNKIGTYTIAIAARHHRIPFYVAAPTSTFDSFNLSEGVRIEERSPSEVTHISGIRVVPRNVGVLNPSFDFTPINLVDAIVSEKGVLNHPTRESVMQFVQKV